MALAACSGISLWLGFTIVTAAALVSIGGIQALRPLLLRIALAQPVARSTHTAPTPQGGGIAVIAATLLASSAFATLACPVAPGIAHAFWIALIAATFISAVGIADDIKALPVAIRLILQSIAVAAVVLSLPAEFHYLPLLPAATERTLLFVGGLWFVNLVNFMDGIDWMTVSAITPVTLGIALLGALDAVPPEGVIVALALFGGLLGFAPFNRPVASLFLGDAGSLPIGLLVGWLLALLAGRGHLTAALLLPLYYLADTGVTLLRRLRAGEQVWVAHRTHFYQRATGAGFSASQIVARVAAVNLLLVLLATLTVLFPTKLASLTALLCGAALVAWLLRHLVRGPR